MADRERPVAPPKIRLWRSLPILITMGLAVHLLLPQITTLEKSWSVVQDMAPWAVALAIIAQVLSYAGSGYTLHALLDANQERLSVLDGGLITMASYSIGLVAGGWVGGAAATYGWVYRVCRDRSTAILAGTLPAMLNNAVLVSTALVGTAYLLVIHNLSQEQLIEFGLILLALVVLTSGIILALRSPKPVIKLAVWLNSRWAALRHKTYSPKETVASLSHFVNAWNSLGNGRWRRPALGAVASIGFDMLTLYFLFIAAGQEVGLGVLFAGYGLPLILGKMAFMIPGGVGVIETSMAAFYTSLDVPSPVSVVVILGYRLLSFWLPGLLGFAAAAYLSRLPVSPEREQA